MTYPLTRPALPENTYLREFTAYLPAIIFQPVSEALHQNRKEFNSYPGPYSCKIFLAIFPFRGTNSRYITFEDHQSTHPINCQRAQKHIIAHTFCSIQVLEYFTFVIQFYFKFILKFTDLLLFNSWLTRKLHYAPYNLRFDVIELTLSFLTFSRSFQKQAYN